MILITTKRFLIILISTLLFISYSSKNSYSQSAENHVLGIQASWYTFSGLNNKYSLNKFTAFSLGAVNRRSENTRSMIELFYSNKQIETYLYQTKVKDYILTYGGGVTILDFLSLLKIFGDMGLLLGYESTDNHNKYDDNKISSPFKSGLVFGGYVQVNAELYLLRWLELYVRAQMSYNGTVVHEQWPFYQSIGIRVMLPY
ncbi:MAG: hypothetical protein ACQPRH_05075 [Solitalea-like symbiont of Tyrophagus putrescentiae]